MAQNIFNFSNLAPNEFCPVIADWRATYLSHHACAGVRAVQLSSAWTSFCLGSPTTQHLQAEIQAAHHLPAYTSSRLHSFQLLWTYIGYSWTISYNHFTILVTVISNFSKVLTSSPRRLPDTMHRALGLARR